MRIIPTRAISAVPWLVIGLALIASTPAAASASEVDRRLIGVDLASGFYDPEAILAFEENVAEQHVDIVQQSVSWGYVGGESWNEFPSWRVRDILARGSTPEITWVPKVNGGGLDQPAMNLRTIYEGTHDDYVRRFARAARDVGEPIMIRFANEMNGDWMSFSENNSGNARGDFVKAWRYVHDIFRNVGATNVKWIWAPNITMPDAPTLAEFYPGDQYVDWAGLDGYAYPEEGCRQPGRIFGPALADIATFSTLPVMIAEVGVAEECPNKPGWIDALFDLVDRHPDVRALTWWHRSEPGTTWLADSTSATQSAYARGVARFVAPISFSQPPSGAPVVPPGPLAAPHVQPSARAPACGTAQEPAVAYWLESGGRSILRIVAPRRKVTPVRAWVQGRSVAIHRHRRHWTITLDPNRYSAATYTSLTIRVQFRRPSGRLVSKSFHVRDC